MKQFSLSANERIKQKKDFDLVFESGKILVSENKKLKALFFICDSFEPGVKFAPGISKRAGNAVWRNRLKRLIKQSYRLNKHLILEKSLACNKSVLIVVSLNKMNKKFSPRPSLFDIEPQVINLIKRIADTF